MYWVNHGEARGEEGVGLVGHMYEVGLGWIV